MRKLMTLTIVMILAAAISVSAQDVKPFNLYFGAGASSPSGDWNDFYGMGFHGMAGLGFKASPAFEIIPKLEYHAFGPDKDAYTALYQLGGETYTEGGNTKAFMFGADTRLSFGAPIAPTKPFVQAGLGFANVSLSDIKTDLATYSANSETKLYYSFGGGLEFAAGPSMKLFFMGRYVSIQTEGSSLSMLPISVGLRF